ncbi:hypothetical protein [Streptomyces sp. NPDC002133]|uniref:hypothetical protein n=1 Tax=Streptomyces sp. NPDC002133 TaxID=3154409 RepID=UPI00332C0BF9
MRLNAVSLTVPGALLPDFGWSRQRALLMPRLRAAPGRRSDVLPEPGGRAGPHPFP